MNLILEPHMVLSFEVLKVIVDNNTENEVDVVEFSLLLLMIFKIISIWRIRWSSSTLPRIVAHVCR